MGNVYIVWESGGSWEDSYKTIYKIFYDEAKAKKCCDKLNKKLHSDKKLQDELAEHYFVCEAREECEICRKYNDLPYNLEEQLDYIVQCVEVE